MDEIRKIMQRAAVQAILKTSPDVLSAGKKNLIEQEALEQTNPGESDSGPSRTAAEQADLKELSVRTKSAQEAAKDDPHARDPSTPTALDINNGLRKATRHLGELSVAVSRIGINSDLAHSAVIKKLRRRWRTPGDWTVHTRLTVYGSVILLIAGHAEALQNMIGPSCRSSWSR